MLDALREDDYSAQVIDEDVVGAIERIVVRKLSWVFPGNLENDAVLDHALITGVDGSCEPLEVEAEEAMNRRRRPLQPPLEPCENEGGFDILGDMDAADREARRKRRQRGVPRAYPPLEDVLPIEDMCNLASALQEIIGEDADGAEYAAFLFEEERQEVICQTQVVVIFQPCLVPIF